MNKLSVNELPIGTRGTARLLIDIYTRQYLSRNGFKVKKYELMIFMSAQTKFGEMVVYPDDVLTYIGNKKWSISKDE